MTFRNLHYTKSHAFRSTQHNTRRCMIYDLMKYNNKNVVSMVKKIYWFTSLWIYDFLLWWLTLQSCVQFVCAVISWQMEAQRTIISLVCSSAIHYFVLLPNLFLRQNCVSILFPNWERKTLQYHQLSLWIVNHIFLWYTFGFSEMQFTLLMQMSFGSIADTFWMKTKNSYDVLV